MNDTLAVFAAEVRRPDADVNLGRAALLIAAAEYPHLSLGTCLELLDEIAASVSATLPADAPPRRIAHALRRRLFHDLEFHGNSATYNDPRNSYLNEVLVRRTGIPITLATVFLEVARRIGLDAAGVSYPRHFLVKYRDEGQEWIVDPFHNGQEFAGKQLRAHLTTDRATPEHLVEYYLSGVTRRQMLTRMLTNLKLVYTQSADWLRALRVQEYLLAINPWSFPDIRDRGTLRARTGDPTNAITDLETYLEHAGAVDDRAAVTDMIVRLRAGLPTDG